MMISNENKPFGLHGLYKNISALRVNPYPAKLIYLNFQPLKWLKTTHICLIWNQTFANPDVQTHISFPTAVIDNSLDQQEKG